MFFRAIYKGTLIMLFLSPGLYASFSISDIVSYVNPKKQEDISTYEHHLDSDGTVYASTTYGSIAIKTWNHEKLIIEVVKQGSEKELASLSLTTTFTDDEAHITASQHQKRHGTVDLNIIVPRKATLVINVKHGSIHISQPRGPVDAQGLKGSITLLDSTNVINASLDSGNILIKQKMFKEPTTITAQSSTGNITLELPRSSNSDFIARTLNGKLTSDLYVTPAQQHTKLNSTYWNKIKRECTGTIGDGGSLIKLITKHGSINITDY